jgi:hypothetical protein
MGISTISMAIFNSLTYTCHRRDSPLKESHVGRMPFVTYHNCADVHTVTIKMVLTWRWFIIVTLW